MSKNILRMVADLPRDRVLSTEGQYIKDEVKSTEENPVYYWTHRTILWDMNKGAELYRRDSSEYTDAIDLHLQLIKASDKIA